MQSSVSFAEAAIESANLVAVVYCFAVLEMTVGSEVNRQTIKNNNIVISPCPPQLMYHLLQKIWSFHSYSIFKLDPSHISFFPQVLKITSTVSKLVKLPQSSSEDTCEARLYFSLFRNVYYHHHCHHHYYGCYCCYIMQKNVCV